MDLHAGAVSAFGRQMQQWSQSVACCDVSTLPVGMYTLNTFVQIFVSHAWRKSMRQPQAAFSLLRPSRNLPCWNFAYGSVFCKGSLLVTGNLVIYTHATPSLSLAFGWCFKDRVADRTDFRLFSLSPLK